MKFWSKFKHFHWKKNTLENVCEISAILSRLQCLNKCRLCRASLTNNLAISAKDRHSSPYTPRLFFGMCIHFNYLSSLFHWHVQDLHDNDNMFSELSINIMRNILRCSSAIADCLQMDTKLVCKGQPHDDVIKWKHFPRDWPFVREFTGYRRIPLTKASHAELWWINGSVKNREAGDLRRHRAQYDVTVMYDHLVCLLNLRWISQPSLDIVRIICVRDIDSHQLHASFAW